MRGHKNGKLVKDLVVSIIMFIFALTDLTDNKVILYVIGLFIAFTSLGVGMVLTDKKK